MTYKDLIKQAHNELLFAARKLVVIENGQTTAQAMEAQRLDIEEWHALFEHYVKTPDQPSPGLDRFKAKFARLNDASLRDRHQAINDLVAFLYKVYVYNTTRFYMPNDLKALQLNFRTLCEKEICPFLRKDTKVDDRAYFRGLINEKLKSEDLIGTERDQHAKVFDPKTKKTNTRGPVFQGSPESNDALKTYFSPFLLKLFDPSVTIDTLGQLIETQFLNATIGKDQAAQFSALAAILNKISHKHPSYPRMNSAQICYRMFSALAVASQKNTQGYHAFKISVAGDAELTDLLPKIEAAAAQLKSSQIVKIPYLTADPETDPLFAVCYTRKKSQVEVELEKATAKSKVNVTWYSALYGRAKSFVSPTAAFTHAKFYLGFKFGTTAFSYMLLGLVTFGFIAGASPAGIAIMTIVPVVWGIIVNKLLSRVLKKQEERDNYVRLNLAVLDDPTPVDPRPMIRALFYGKSSPKVPKSEWYHILFDTPNNECTEENAKNLIERHFESFLINLFNPKLPIDALSRLVKNNFFSYSSEADKNLKQMRLYAVLLLFKGPNSFFPDPEMNITQYQYRLYAALRMLMDDPEYHQFKSYVSCESEKLNRFVPELLNKIEQTKNVTKLEAIQAASRDPHLAPIKEDPMAALAEQKSQWREDKPKSPRLFSSEWVEANRVPLICGMAAFGVICVLASFATGIGGALALVGIAGVASITMASVIPGTGFLSGGVLALMLAPVIPTLAYGWKRYKDRDQIHELSVNYAEKQEVRLMHEKQSQNLLHIPKQGDEPEEPSLMGRAKNWYNRTF